MRAVTAPDPGGPDALRLVDLPSPRPAPDELLVAVRATAVNRADLLQREGRYPPPPGASDILGLELAGEVAEVGDAVTAWRVGDAVCAVVAGGGYAEEAVVPAATALPVPAGMSFAEAAARGSRPAASSAQRRASTTWRTTSSRASAASPTAGAPM